MNEIITVQDFERIDGHVKPYYYKTTEYKGGELTDLYRLKFPIPSSTGSEFGSYHWFHTLMARHLHCGEFLKDKSPDKETLRKWGEDLYKTSSELLAWFKLFDRGK